MYKRKIDKKSIVCSTFLGTDSAKCSLLQLFTEQAIKDASRDKSFNFHWRI